MATKRRRGKAHRRRAGVCCPWLGMAPSRLTASETQLMASRARFVLTVSLALGAGLAACSRPEPNRERDERAPSEGTRSAATGSPRPPASAAAAAPAAVGYAVGDGVLVEWRGSWARASIREVRSAEYKVHYEGWGAEWDEVVSPSRVRPLSAGGGLPVAATWNAGDRVQVQWKGAWYPATILEVSGNGYRVHYDGYGANWDEVVAPYRVKAR